MRPLTPLLAAVALASTAFVALADQEATDDERQVDVTAGNDVVVVTLRQTEGARDENVVQVRLSTATGNLDTTFLVDEDDAGSARTLANRMQMLVEFRDEDGDGQYDTDEEVRSAWLMSGGAERTVNATVNGTAVWTPFEVMDETQGNEDCKRIRTTGTLNGVRPADPLPAVPAPVVEQGKVHLEAWACGDDIEIDGQPSRATDVKVSWRIEGYDVQDGESRLALVFDSNARDELRTEDERIGTDHGGVATTTHVAGRDATLLFTWAAQARAGPGTQDVEYTELVDERSRENQDGSTQANARLVYALAYTPADNVTHDGVLAAHYSDDRADDRGEAGGDVPGPGVWAAVAGLGAVALLRRRKA